MPAPPVVVTYTADFDRIGRTHNPPPLDAVTTIDDDAKIDADAVAAQLARFADDPTHAGARDSRTGTAGRRYVADGAPCCLVARIMHNQGATVAALRELDREGNGHGVRISASRAAVARRYTRGALELLDFVQRIQDSGSTWDVVAARVLRATNRRPQ